MDYLKLAATGKTSWIRYTVAIVIILFFWLILGGVPLGVTMLLGNVPIIVNGVSSPQPTNILQGIDPFFTFFLPISFSFLSLLIGLYMAVKFIHKRRFMSLITTNPKINWKRFGQGFAIFFILVFLTYVVDYFLNPASFEISLDVGRWLLFAPLTIICILIQITSEEILFRGYLMQLIGGVVKNPIVPVLVSSFLFMAVHIANPELSGGTLLFLLYYFSVGLFLAIITIKDNGLELAFGVHAAINLFILIVNYKNSALEVLPSIFKTTDSTQSGILFDFILFIIIATLFYAVFFKLMKK